LRDYSRHSHSHAWDFRLDLETLYILIFELCYETRSYVVEIGTICEFDMESSFSSLFCIQISSVNAVLSYFMRWSYEFLHRVWFYNLYGFEMS